MQDTTDKTQDIDQLSAADRSLSDAFRISFIILTVIMVAIVIYFLLFGGFRTVESGEQALVLRFGKIQGIGEDRLRNAGLRWALPYPIDEVISIPVTKKVNLAIGSFWYLERQRPPAALDPVYDGYCIIRGQGSHQNNDNSGGNDYNIIHSKWQLTYQIDDPESFFKNVYTDDVEPGQSYEDVIAESIKPLLENLIADSIVNTMVYYTIDEAISNQHGITEHVKRLLQAKLQQTESGIKVASVQLKLVWPQQLDAAFLNSIKAPQVRDNIIGDAESYLENTLNETAGSVAAELLEIIEGKKTVSEQQEELLWSEVAGAAQDKISQAKAYQRRVVETAKANAKYLQEILPEYRKRPELVLQKIYQSAIEEIFDNAEEKMIDIFSAGKGSELRLLLNRDPAVKSRSEQK